MNRILVAAAAALVCSSVSAQSSVTLFGVVDTGIGYGKGSIASSRQVLSSGLATSRLGFRGTEDLGGGLSASFWLESQLSSDTGAGSATNTNNQASGGAPAGAAGGQGLTFGRRATVSIASDRWGEVRLGRDYMPSFQAQSAYDPFGAVGIGATQSLFGAFAATAPFSRSGGSGSILVRASNSVGYHLPKTGFGAYGSVLTYRGENAPGAATSSDGNGTSVRLGWTNGTADVSGAYARTKYASGDLTTKTIGGAYRFGNGLRFSASVVRDDLSSALPDGRGWLVGVVFPIGPGQLQGSYSGYRLDDATQSGAKKLAVAYVYNLSKRTALYAIAAQLRNHGASAQALNSGLTAAGTTASGISIGVRHAF